MKIMHIATLAITLLAGTVCWAAVSPSQVGSYAGTLKVTAYFDGGGKQVSSVQMLMNIAQDGGAIFTINGAQWPTAGNNQPPIYTGTEAVCALIDPTQPDLNVFILTVFHFKGTSIKGRMLGLYNVSPPPSAIFVKSTDAKFTLKKL